VQDATTLCDEIDTLLAAGSNGDVAQLECTLTDGYAQALSLEAERGRIERRMGEVAATIGNGDSLAGAREFSALAARLAHTADELTRLRRVLGELRRRTAVIRSASPV